VFVHDNCHTKVSVCLVSVVLFGHAYKSYSRMNITSDIWLYRLG